MQELWGMRSTSLLPSLPGPLWLGVKAPDRVKYNQTVYLNKNYTYTKLDWFGLLGFMAYQPS